MAPKKTGGAEASPQRPPPLESAVTQAIVAVKSSSPAPLRKVKPVVNVSEEALIARIEALPGRITQAHLELDRSGQHTLTWRKPVRLPVTIDRKPALLPPGTCNLYKYPRVFFDGLRKGKAIIPPLEQLYVLEEIVRALILDENDVTGIAHRLDSVGATPLMGILVSNTKASLGLAIDVYRNRPQLLQQCHEPKIFTGENAFHILSVNGRQDELCECIEIAASRLERAELQKIFWTQATGIFFSEAPMSYYGGTVISYMVAFSLQKALLTLLRCSRQYKAMRGVIDLNDPRKSACKLTGMLPLHVAVANSLTSMFNFLVDLPGLPIEFDDMRARTDVMSQYGTQTNLSLLNPLQVATKLGDKKLVQYILRTQSKVQWVWGPVSSYNLDLHGIDSCGDSGNDVMEICARLDALEDTQEMLLDTFMAGLLNELFVQKFRTSKYLHYVMRVLDMFYMGSIYALSYYIRRYPATVLKPGDDVIVQLLPYLNLIFIVPLLEEDLRVSYVWWSNARSGPQDPETKRLMKKGGHALWVLWRRDLLMLLAWMRSHNMYVKFLGWAFAILASVMLLLMRTCSDHYWATNFPDFVDASDKTDILRIPLSLASFLHGLAFFSALLFQFEKLGIFYKTVFQMLASDVFNWMILFMIFIFNYGVVMWISYPQFVPEADAILQATPERVAAIMSQTEPAPQFIHPLATIQSLVELGFIGEPIAFDLKQGFMQTDGTTRGTMKLLLFLAFSILYCNYIIMSLVLLLNLLIAMMGDTYSSALEHATRQFRVNFARLVLRLELQLTIFSKMGLVSLNCGEQVGTGKDAVWVYNYRNYQPNAEGGGTRGAKPSMFDEDVEKEAEEDAEDDEGPGAGSADDTLAGSGATIAPSAAAPMDEPVSTAGTNPAAAQKLRQIGNAVVFIQPMKTPREGEGGGDDV